MSLSLLSKLSVSRPAHIAPPPSFAFSSLITLTETHIPPFVVPPKLLTLASALCPLPDMNFSPDGLEASPGPPPPAPPRRDDVQSERAHYTNEFQIYQKQRTNGTGVTKRAKCKHCGGDWAYNETRLKHHITDIYRGCRRIPPEARERVRVADTHNNPVNTTGALATQSPTHPSLPPTKRKREPTTLPPSLPVQNQPVVSVGVVPELPVTLAAGGDAQAQIRIVVEFSMTSGTLMRATWIASELISEFHRDIVEVGLVPRITEHTFNIWISGKMAWSRGVGQPLPDYDHLRHIVRAQCVNPAL